MKTEEEIRERIKHLKNGIIFYGNKDHIGALVNKIVINVLKWVLEESD